MRRGTMSIGVLLLGSAIGLLAQPTKSGNAAKIDPVAVVGCLQESKPNQWTLVNASEPVASHPNAPSAKELAGLPKGGTRTFELIGVTVFNLPAHRGQTVVVKGLPVDATPADRLNVTSVTTVAPTCSARPQKPATI